MSTIDHKIEELNQDGTGYDTYHPETNVNQVYDFTRFKWLGEVLSDIETKLSSLSDDVDILELSDRVDSIILKIDSAEGLIDAIQNELALKYSKPTGGIPIEDLNSIVRESLTKADRVVQIESDLSQLRVYIDSQVTAVNTALEEFRNVKVEAYKHEIVAVIENQRGFDVSDVFNSVTDTLIEIAQNSSILRASRYTIENNNIYLTEGVNVGTVISFTILKNIPLKEQQSQLIDGDLMAGYYGKVDGLTTGDELFAKTGLTAGITKHSGDITWLKFSHNYKTLLVADRTLKHSVSWDDIQAQNLVKGKVVEIDGKYYLCRLMRGGDSNPTPRNVDASGEWGDLIIRFTPNTIDSHWSNVDDVNAGKGSVTWLQEVISTNLNNRANIGFDNVATIKHNPSSSIDSLFGYRPVLELL